MRVASDCPTGKHSYFQGFFERRFALSKKQPGRTLEKQQGRKEKSPLLKQLGQLILKQRLEIIPQQLVDQLCC